MPDAFTNLVNGYKDMMSNQSDPRVKDWAMMSSPFPTVAICLGYAYFSKVLGPKLMENRKPFNLRRILIFYNLAQTIFSTWIFYEYLMSGWARGYSFRCQPVDYTESPLGLRMAATCWWYYFSKFTEFFDTLFFILRKKNQHVSTLHVIHHGIMPFSVWMGLKFAPGGHSTFFALLNTFVHIVMYFYYMIAAMGPEYQKYIWWKKYLTTFQMVQFVAIMTHQFQLLFTECDYPRTFMIWIGLHGLLFLGLFSDFYKTKYTGSDKKRKGGSAVTANGKSNNGACMPVLEDDESKKNGFNGTYPKIKEYNSCYSNGVNNGYVANNNSNEKKVA
ncbi:elongation of very long chain fatty acids protein AAEL008004-like [Trichogramma pretiosum]|uniref:Elongation of very long chain fatty acids protein n=1 Tax=Trichogramma kaykai TaxID=54128 RepID=A0ABD2WH00_9HYME|nr:elongation of very long chain fatty acids protein AAEL008004-like [Trichogramma pretiosum]XP_014237358.1 elongation of very long chain fatty acids protein AAEL008004-like [Trichogramma pretiosum]XP_014237359.1 elongation of very long chain fatty acids protein AAEL008004-like [Trichogramma pretiosum]